MSSEENINASLELLLDTICNTFGGVLFISMLVIIMTNLTSKEASLTPPTESSQQSMTEKQQELNAHLKELNTFREAVQQQSAIGKQVSNPDARRILEQVKQLKSQRADLAKESGASAENASKSQTDVNKIAANLKKLDEEMAAAKAALAIAEKRLRDEVASRSRAARLPKLRATTKMEIAFFLKQGRFTPYVTKARDGTLGPNQADILSTSTGGQQFVEPKPGAGIAITPAGDANGQVARTFADYDKSKHYLAVFVWPDSFDHFAVVKEAMVLGQFEYRLVVLPKDQKVPVSSSVGATMVQ